MVLREMALGEAANERDRQLPLAGFIDIEHIDDIAAAVLDAEFVDGEGRFHVRPECGERHPRSVEGECSCIECLIESVEGSGCRSPDLELRLVDLIGDVRGGNKAAQRF